MKKILCLALILACVMQIPDAITESVLTSEAITEAPTHSIFDDLLPKPTKAPKLKTKAPSYGAMSFISSDSTTENKDGGTILTYYKVGKKEFESFINYAKNQGFSIVEQGTQDGQLGYIFSNGIVQFTVIYNESISALYNVYSKGTEYEECLFPGYKPVYLWNTITVKGLGKFTFKKFSLNEKMKQCSYLIRISEFNIYHDNTENKFYDDFAIYSWLTFNYSNTTEKSKSFSNKANDLFDVKLHYINDDSTFTYFNSGSGLLYDGFFCTDSIPSHNLKSFSYGIGATRYDYYEANPIGSLSSHDCCISFNLPDGLRTSTDGTIAVTISFKTGEKYVLILRENGENKY